MSATQVLFHIIGSIRLLLWGLRMVQTGISRGFGAQLRQVIQNNTSNRFSAFGAGILVTILVQSSTATALITSSFARNGFISLTAALAVMIGADVGTTLVAQVLSLDLSLLPFLMIAIGFILHKNARSLQNMQLGRVIIGLAMMLFALSFIQQSAEPLKQSELIVELFVSLENEPIVAVIIAALIAFIVHSSLATVLLISSLVAAGTVPLPLGITLLLGANLGGAIPPVMATLGSGTLARRVTLGNLIIKSIGVFFCLPFIDLLIEFVPLLSLNPSRIIIDAHLAFNTSLAILFLPIVSGIAALTEKIIVENEQDQIKTGVKYLDEELISTPVLALSNASREVLHMTEHVERMLQGIIVAMKESDIKIIDELCDIDDLVDAHYEQIKLYVTKISKNEMSSDESLRCAEILLFVTNLEHIGDIAENILNIARKKATENLSFSKEGFSEIEILHKDVTSNLSLATSMFITGDISIARQLVEEKTEINKLQNQFTQNHLERLRRGKPESIATSSLHLDILRDLRRVHSHISAVAYPVLEKAGSLRKSRLRKSDR